MDLTSAAEAAFTFIAPRVFQHPKTHAHGPCFKTGRMDPYDRQLPKYMVRDHRPNDRQQSRGDCKQSTAFDSQTDGRDPSHKKHALRPPRSGPSHEENRAVTERMPLRGRTDLPSRHLPDPVPTNVDVAQEKCNGQEERARDRGPFRSAKRERHFKAAKVFNHISSLLLAIKFLHKEDGPHFNNVSIKRQLPAPATILQREGDLERPSTQ